MKNPLVSVIITTRNSGMSLEKLLSSIQNQTYKEIETIVVDNNSNDSTLTIARKFTAKVFNKGPERSAQRNYGAKKSKGRYLVFLDSDMELTPKVIEDCVEKAEKLKLEAFVIPERTVGSGVIARIRKFEREMYIGDPTIELARFFDRQVFFEFGGYDERLTGPEDYDLPYRISKKYEIGRTGKYILHHEEGLTLGKLLKKKYYYGSKGSLYATKHPELIRIQGTILFRMAYLKNWKKFVKNPRLGIAFIFLRSLEAVFAVSGFVSSVGFINFVKTLPKLFIPRKRNPRLSSRG